jgi:hypothetical protein
MDLPVLGVTGSSEPIPNLQRLGLLSILGDLRHARNPFISSRPFEWMHNGDCINADHEMACIWRRLGGKVHGHPPDNPLRRAFFHYELMDGPLPYGQRDQKIVGAADLLVAAPRKPEYTRSGTWMTVRMARRKGIPIILIWPDGSRTTEA